MRCLNRQEDDLLDGKRIVCTDDCQLLQVDGGGGVVLGVVSIMPIVQRVLVFGVKQCLVNGGFGAEQAVAHDPQQKACCCSRAKAPAKSA